MLTLIKLPADVLLDILGYCGLRDIISFSMVCKHLHFLSQNRSLWISALKQTSLSRPIPLPTHADLKPLPLPKLRSLALHTLRLEQNLSLAEPKIIGPIKSVQLDTNLDLIFQVPGTELYLFHSRALGCIVCWDVGLGKAVTEPIEAGERILDVSPGEDMSGVFSMGVLLQKLNRGIWDSLIIISVNYSDPTNIKVDIPFRHNFPDHDFHWAVFMNAEIIGVLQVPRDIARKPNISIAAFNRTTRKHVLLETDVPYNDHIMDGHCGSSSFNNNVFILIESADLSFRYQCPASVLPYASNPISCTKLQVKMGSVPPIQWEAFPRRVRYRQIGPLSADPWYGVPAVSLHQISALDDAADDDSLRILIRFWTRSDREEGYTNSMPTIIPTCCAYIQGELWSSPSLTWQLMLLPHSGRQVLLVVKEDEEVKLLLVRLRADMDLKKATVHRLNVPSFIGLGHVYGLSLDDHRGVITLLDTRGFLFAIPYA